MAGAVELRDARLPGLVAAHGGTAPPARLRLAVLALPPSVIAVSLAGLAIGARAWFGPAFTLAPLGLAVAGALVFVAGLVAVGWSFALFVAADTPVRLHAQPLQLIEEGPYRVSRHPMYLGLAVMLLGAALLLGMPLLVLAALAFVGIVSRMHVPHEEAQLLARFGGWYRDYAGGTRRWL